MIEGNLDIGGAVVFWSLADGTDRDRLRDGFGSLNLDAFVPEPWPAPSVLRDALEDVLGGPRVLVRPLATRDGFAVVQEDRGTAANAYATTLVARVMGVTASYLRFDPEDDRADRVREAFRIHASRVPATQLSAVLVKVVESLGGIRLRPGGAVYWVAGHKLEDWAAVARVVELASLTKPSAVYVIRHRLDGEAVRAVRDAVVAEVAADAERIATEVQSGELGSRALESRRQEASQLRSKVLLYEDLLSVGLAGLHAVVDSADQATATASLLLAATSETSVAVAAE